MKKSTQDKILKDDWLLLINKLRGKFGKEANMNTILFLIGVQELGKGVKKFKKEEKQDLIHIAICKILSYSGIYRLEGLDRDGWPHWKLNKEFPLMTTSEQENFLKRHILEYFRRETDVV